MKRLSDEILNKYLDNELDDESRVKVQNQLEFSEEDRKRFTAFKVLDASLRKVKPAEVSTEFTSLLMSKLMKKRKARKEQNIFIFSISSVFVIISLVIIGVAFSIVLNSAGGQSSPGMLLSLADKAAEIISYGFSGKNLSIIGSVISFGIIISAYFFFDAQKHARKLK